MPDTGFESGFEEPLRPETGEEIAASIARAWDAEVLDPLADLRVTLAQAMNDSGEIDRRDFRYATGTWEDDDGEERVEVGAGV